MHYEFTGLIFGGAYCRNFTVFNSFIPSKHSKAFPRQFQFLINRPPYLNSLIIYDLILSMFFLPRTFPLPVIIQCMTETVYRPFHSRGQHLCKFIGTKEKVYIRK